MSPSKRIQRVMRRQAQLEDAAARRARRLLADLRRSVLRAIGEASGFRLFHLSQLLLAIDLEIARARAAVERMATELTRDAFRLGVELADLPFEILLGKRPSLVDISGDLLAAAVDVTTDQVRAVWSELGTRLKGEVRRTALGVTDPDQAMSALARAIRNPKTFGSAANRAEAIIRTEVNRTFSLGTWKRANQTNNRVGGGVGKYWLHTHDDRVRDSHIAAGEEYTVDTPIALDKPFIVGGAKLMFPLDPRGPAKETVRCRCRMLLSMKNVAVTALRQVA